MKTICAILMLLTTSVCYAYPDPYGYGMVSSGAIIDAAYDASVDQADVLRSAVGTYLQTSDQDDLDQCYVEYLALESEVDDWEVILDSDYDTIDNCWWLTWGAYWEGDIDATERDDILDQYDSAMAGYTNGLNDTNADCGASQCQTKPVTYAGGWMGHGSLTIDYDVKWNGEWYYEDEVRNEELLNAGLDQWEDRHKVFIAFLNLMQARMDSYGVATEY